MNCKSRISIITAVKNGVEHLEETIRNVISIKNVADIDFIVIDGGSTDGTIDIIKRYADHIYYWISEPDEGIYGAMNKGWNTAPDNSFILFLGSGDEVISLPENINCYRQNDVVFGNVYMGGTCVFKARADYHLKLYNSLHHQALLVNKALHPAPPFNCKYPTYADFDFNQRLLKSGANFKYSADFIGYASLGGVSGRGPFIESLRIIAKNFGFMWVTVALSGYYAMKIFPFLKRIRPLRKI